MYLPRAPEYKTLLPIKCFHGDTHQVPARKVTIAASPGSWPIEVDIVKDLPVPFLLGRDWPGFERLLAAVTQSVTHGGNRRRRAPPKQAQQWPALLTSDSGRDGEYPSRESNMFFNVFQQVTGGGSFGRKQREDDRLKHCWKQMRVMDGKELHPTPHPYLHFIVVLVIVDFATRLNFNQTLKQMLRRVAAEDRRDWD
ncbi:hypothetical protein QQF64_034462 [Cirrhinus molitorella]|uniref:Uncharacterized protein n=1 Tax=Cirrhinus molitorella TaxID=172907 RepID=A0ABR3L2I3_9TELE